jgi:hypothetical protein
MTRDELIDTLLPVMVNCGESPAGARRRLWRMSTSALKREMLLRGVVEYDDPPPEEPEESCEDDFSACAVLRWPQAPLYSD